MMRNNGAAGTVLLPVLALVGALTGGSCGSSDPAGTWVGDYTGTLGVRATDVYGVSPCTFYTVSEGDVSLSLYEAGAATLTGYLALPVDAQGHGSTCGPLYLRVDAGEVDFSWSAGMACSAYPESTSTYVQPTLQMLHLYTENGEAQVTISGDVRRQATYDSDVCLTTFRGGLARSGS